MICLILLFKLSQEIEGKVFAEGTNRAKISEEILWLYRYNNVEPVEFMVQ